MTVVISGTAGIQNVLGSAAAPSNTNVTSTNTGVYFPTSTTLGIATAGVNAVTVDASQNVGIGTSSPTFPLDVGGPLANIRVAPSTATNNALTRYVNTGGTGYVGLDNSTGALTASYALNLYHTGAYPIVFSTSGTERMRIDSSGNVGIGTNSPSTYAKLVSTTGDNATTFAAVGATNMLRVQGYNSTYVGTVLEAVNLAQSANTPLFINGSTLKFGISGTTQATIDSSGRLLVGTTSATIGGASVALALDATTANTGYGLGINGNASNTQVARFAYAGTAVGSINITSSATSYLTASDYRLKNTIASMTGALAKVALLKPVTYKWNVDGSDGQGFIAHELQAVIPDCVVGEKDAVDADGNPQYQGIDTSFLVATLTAAIQEQQALITQLTDRIAALEAK